MIYYNTLECVYTYMYACVYIYIYIGAPARELQPSAPPLRPDGLPPAGGPHNTCVYVCVYIYI